MTDETERNIFGEELEKEPTELESAIQEFAEMMGDDVAEPLRKMFRSVQPPEAKSPEAQVLKLKDQALSALMVGDQETAKKNYKAIRALGDQIGLGAAR